MPSKRGGRPPSSRARGAETTIAEGGGVSPGAEERVMEDHLSDQATAGDGPEAARGRPRRSSRADLKDPALTIQPEMVLQSNFPFRTFICV